MSTFALHERLAQDTLPVASLDLSEVLLMKDERFPWLILVPRISDAREIHKLNASQREQLFAEIQLTSEALESLFSPYKLNVAALGNQVAQLHVHVVARFQEDAAWPAPVWGNGTAEPYQRASVDALVQRIVASISR